MKYVVFSQFHYEGEAFRWGYCRECEKKNAKKKVTFSEKNEYSFYSEYDEDAKK